MTTHSESKELGKPIENEGTKGAIAPHAAGTEVVIMLLDKEERVLVAYEVVEKEREGTK